VGLAIAGGVGSSPGALVSTTPPGPERLVRAYGLGSSSRQPVFSLANGDDVAITTGPAGSCLVRTLAGRDAGETCAAGAGIAEGKGITVTDECGSASRHLMEITGLAPAGTATVLLRSTDGAGQTTVVVDGAFRFDGTNPQPGSPYPAGVEWLREGGRTVGSASLPVEGGRFCLPAD